MSLRQVIEAYGLLDSAHVDGAQVARALAARGLTEVVTRRIEAPPHHTDVVQVRVRGSRGAAVPALGVIGRLGGVGARPERLGLVSDADGALAAVAIALSLADMRARGDALDGDVIVSTHVCPAAPTRPHHPVPFMASPVDREVLGRAEIHPDMRAVLSIDASRGNRVVNARGIAITPTVCQGWILRVSEDLVDILQWVTGAPAVVFPITMQDITPYANGVYHVNSIVQPAAFTPAPVVGVATTAVTAVPGCATGASQVEDVERAVRFVIEAAKAYGRGACRLLDDEEFRTLVALYGPMTHLQTPGRQRR